MVQITIPSTDYKYWLKRLETKLNEPTKQKVPKIVRKRYYKTLGTSVINFTMSPSSLISISPSVT